MVSLLLLIKGITCAFEAYVVDGNKTMIKFFPHAVFLSIFCQGGFICGGSILNQMIVLTAAHCVEDCHGGSRNSISIKFGHELLNRMSSVPVIRYLIHERYNHVTMKNDIGLVLARNPMKLSEAAQRVVLLQSTPKNIKVAHIAGWGVINVSTRFTATFLQIKLLCNASWW